MAALNADGRLEGNPADGTTDGAAGRPWWAGTWGLGLVCGLAVLWLGVRYEPWSEPLTQMGDIDAWFKLHGIAADPSLGAMLGYFWGDDPQHVHTFRPLAAAALWGEWHLFGFTRWPYLVVNLGWLWATVVTVSVIARRLELAEPWATLAGPLLLLWPTRGTLSVATAIATRHDEMCTLFGLWALLALGRWLTTGERRALGGYLGWALAACLCKEQGLAVLLLGVTLAGLRGRREGAPGRLMATVGGSVLLGVVYLAWYKVAAANMGAAPHRSHSFGGMLEMMLQRSPAATVTMFAYSLAWYPADVGRQVWAAGWCAFASPVLWQSMVWAALTLAAWYLCWRDHRRLCALLLAYKVINYLPVLPLHDVWPWYEYMPHVLDPLFYAAVGCTAWNWAVCQEAIRSRLTRRGLIPT